MSQIEDVDIVHVANKFNKQVYAKRDMDNWKVCFGSDSARFRYDGHNLINSLYVMTKQIIFQE